MTISKLLFIFILFISAQSFAQITAGKITFERRTNMLKLYPDEKRARFLNERGKYRTDVFFLYFNDSLSVFIPDEDQVEDNMMGMTTKKNSVVQNSQSKHRVSYLSFWGQDVMIVDSVINREWKITDSHRKIGKYECTKAIFEMNDSTRIYAWYSDEIVPTVGPETYRGLPGAILGLATEDGGVVYFAKTVEVMEPNFDKVTPKVGRKKYTEPEFRKKIEEDYGTEAWGKRLLYDLFFW